ncbi:hypothetical protein PINS_up009824 [Pythium insidiosum]|nr:hypothetical protein PINS_up009824 [Pythium insidiosum]
MIWWWGPCAGASCSVDAVRPRESRALALYDHVAPLRTACDDRWASHSSDASSLFSPSSSSSSSSSHAAAGAASRATALEPGIYRARDVRTHDLVALKVYDKALLRRADTRRRMRHELRVLSRCKEHANVLRLYGVYSSRHTVRYMRCYFL